MWTALTGNTEEELAEGGTDYHDSDCQEERNGGLRDSRNKKSRWRDKGTLEVVMAMCLGLLHVGALVRLVNLGVFIKKERGHVTRKGCITEDSMV